MELVKVEFNQEVIEVVEDGKHWVSVNVICKNLGLHRETQQSKLKSDPTYESKLLKVQTAGGMQEVFCIPLEKLNGWLFSINPNKTKPEVREKLILYKKECFRVLYEHFSQKAQPQALPDKERIGTLEGELTRLRREYTEYKRYTNRVIKNLEQERARRGVDLELLRGRMLDFVYTASGLKDGIYLEAEALREHPGAYRLLMRRHKDLTRVLAGLREHLDRIRYADGTPRSLEG